MQLEHDRAENRAYLWLEDASEVAQSVALADIEEGEAAPGIRLDFDGEERLVGVAFDDARRYVAPELLEGRRRPNARFRGDPDNAAYVELAGVGRGGLGKTLTFQADPAWRVNLDLDHAGHLVGIEFESARDAARGMLTQALIGDATVPGWELPPDRPGTVVAREVVVAETDDVTVCVAGFEAHPEGLLVGFEACDDRRAPEAPPGPPPTAAGRPYDPGPRFRLRLADGRVADRPDSASDPGALAVTVSCGWGPDDLYREEIWLSPLPPEGPLTVIVDWPSADIAGAEAEIDTGLLRTAAAWAPGGSVTATRRRSRPWDPPPPPPVTRLSATGVGRIRSWLARVRARLDQRI